MNTQMQVTRFSPALLWTAGIAIILFCGAGFAALMGWIPASIGQTGNESTVTGKAGASGPAGHQVRKAPLQAAADRPAIRKCVDCGVIESSHTIITQGEASGLGAVGGAVVGGLIGNQIGDGRGQQLATVLGAVGGVVAGNEIEKRAKSASAYDITVRLDDGSSRVIRQANQPAWRTGDKVRIVDGNIQSI